MVSQKVLTIVNVSFSIIFREIHSEINKGESEGGTIKFMGKHLSWNHKAYVLAYFYKNILWCSRKQHGPLRKTDTLESLRSEFESCLHSV